MLEIVSWRPTQTIHEYSFNLCGPLGIDASKLLEEQCAAGTRVCRATHHLRLRDNVELTSRVEPMMLDKKSSISFKIADRCMINRDTSFEPLLSSNKRLNARTESYLIELSSNDAHERGEHQDDSKAQLTSSGSEDAAAANDPEQSENPKFAMKILLICNMNHERGPKFVSFRKNVLAVTWESSAGCLNIRRKIQNLKQIKMLTKEDDALKHDKGNPNLSSKQKNDAPSVQHTRSVSNVSALDLLTQKLLMFVLAAIAVVMLILIASRRYLIRKLAFRTSVKFAEKDAPLHYRY